ncbi:hypothetical protein VRRI112168_20610 [Vreelandella rituensis]
MLVMRNKLPANAHWGAFGIGRHQMPMVAQAVLLGGHVRVGLEDNLYLKKGVLATNAQLVEKAVTLIENLGTRVMTPAETRAHLGLRDPRTGKIVEDIAGGDSFAYRKPRFVCE